MRNEQRSRRFGKIAVATGTSIAALVAGVALAPAAGASSANTSSQPTKLWADRAAASYQALQRYNYLGPDQHSLYMENYPRQSADPTYSYVWTLREATAATVSLNGAAGAPNVKQDVTSRYAALQNYWSSDPATFGYESYLPAPLGTGGDLYYDDNSVIGLELVRGYSATHDVTLLQRAKKTFSAVTRGWDTDPSHVCAGGMKWFESPNNNIRGANITGLASELAGHLYLLTHGAQYLDWTKKLFEWNQRCLQQSPGLYLNDMNYDGTINPTLWSYNSGAMIGAATLLYEATGKKSYLKDAQAEAKGALDYWTSADRLYQQPAIFNAILFNNLLLLDSQAPNGRYLTVLQDYASREWASNRDASTGLFHFGAAGAYDPTAPAQTLEQSAMVQIFAALAWKPADYGHIA